MVTLRKQAKLRISINSFSNSPDVCLNKQTQYIYPNFSLRIFLVVFAIEELVRTLDILYKRTTDPAKWGYWVLDQDGSLFPTLSMSFPYLPSLTSEMGRKQWHRLHPGRTDIALIIVISHMTIRLCLCRHSCQPLNHSYQATQWQRGPRFAVKSTVQNSVA